MTKTASSYATLSATFIFKQALRACFRLRITATAATFATFSPLYTEYNPLLRQLFKRRLGDGLEYIDGGVGGRQAVFLFFRNFKLLTGPPLTKFIQ